MDYVKLNRNALYLHKNKVTNLTKKRVMLRACAELAEASSEASRSSGGSGMLRSEDSAQHDNSVSICKEDVPLDEPCPKNKGPAHANMSGAFRISRD